MQISLESVVVTVGRCHERVRGNTADRRNLVVERDKVWVSISRRTSLSPVLQDSVTPGSTDAHILHCTAHVSENLRLKTQGWKAPDPAFFSLISQNASRTR